MPPNRSVSRTELLQSAPLYAGNADYLEALFEAWLAAPASVPPMWQEYFGRLPAEPALPETSHREVQAGIAARARLGTAVAGTAASKPANEATAKQGAVSRLIQVYANRGHLVAQLDPLGLMQRPRPRVLSSPPARLRPAPGRTRVRALSWRDPRSR